MNIVVLISGRGSNLAALLEADLPVSVAAVISNRDDARGLALARAHGVPGEVVAHRDYAAREAFDAGARRSIAAASAASNASRAA